MRRLRLVERSLEWNLAAIYGIAKSGTRVGGWAKNKINFTSGNPMMLDFVHGVAGRAVFLEQRRSPHPVDLGRYSVDGPEK